MYRFHPALSPFDGEKPVRILLFFANICDAFNTVGDYGDSSVRVLAYFLVGDVTDVHQEQFEMMAFDCSGGRPDISVHGIWPHVGNTLLGGSSAIMFPVRRTMWSQGQPSQTGRMKLNSLRGSRGRLAYAYMSSPKSN